MVARKDSTMVARSRIRLASWLSSGLGALALLVGCGGGAGAGASAESPSDSSSTPYDSSSSDATSESAPEPPRCDDGTCFPCGDGICPVGAYCDEDAQGGAACAWLPECKGTPSCSCVTGVLGGSCSCSEDAGGPVVSCN